MTIPLSHSIQIDGDYIGALIFESATAPADPESMIKDVSEWENLPQAPPPVSGYRPADVQGIACWNCAHFTIVGDPDDDGDLDGICELFEAQADAESTCDRFTAHSDLNRQGPHTSWTEDKLDRQRVARAGITEAEYSDNSVFNTINFSSTEAVEEDNLVWKEILRTGVWKQTPTTKGIIDRELRIIDDGESDIENGIISLSELERNFNDDAVSYVTVPLSDDLNDHKNIARLNTGFVRKLRRRVRDGMTLLEAGIDFTEPDVKGKVLRGTIPDVSAGVPFGVTRRSDKKFFKAVLDHVCLTRRPFIDKLSPFGIAAADGDELPVESWEQESGDQPASPSHEAHPTPPPSENTLSFRQQSSAIRNALTNQLRLGTEYQVDDINGGSATISHRTSKVVWTVPFRLTGQTDNPVIVASVDKWIIVETEEPKAVTASDQPTKADQLRQTRELRELRLSQPTSQTGGIQMSTLSLDGVELSNLDDQARARIQSILNENQTLKRDNATAKVDQRIEELKALPGLNLADRPGALKLYREIMLADDGGPAVVLFSDKPEAERQGVTAIEILDRFIQSLKADGGVQLSDQHLASGSDVKPPNDASGERAPLDDRVETAKQALYGDKNKRRTGRK